MMNCVCSAISATIAPKRPTFASSSGASTSSSRQNGLGLIRKIAKISDTAVSAFSPPDSSSRLRTCLPGGWATISTPVPSMSLGSVSFSVAVPPLNRRGNTCVNMSLTCLKVSTNRSRVVLLILSIASCSCAIAVSRSFFCVDR